MTKQKTALITGAYGGLGGAFAEEHAKTNGGLVLTDRNEQRLREQKTRLEQKYGVPVKTVAADLTKPEDVLRLHRESGPVEYLICNAGFGGQGAFVERDAEKDMAMVAVNVQAPTLLLKLFLADMVARGSGRVLLISSIAAKLPGPLQAVYFASKAYAASLGNALSQELKGTGVTLTTALPGILATDFAEKGHLQDTLLFAGRADPERAAAKAYAAMLAGKMNVSPGVQLPFRLMLPLVPLLPKPAVTAIVYAMQKKGSAKNDTPNAVF